MISEASKRLRNAIEALGVKPVRPCVYPGTYAIIAIANMMAEDVANRSSASWKKAENIFFDTVIPNDGQSILPYWRAFQKSNPDGESSTQSLYVPAGKGVFVKYDACCNIVGKMKLEKFFD